MARILIATMLMIFLCVSARGALTLVRDGQSDYVIVLNEGAIPAEQTAATELQNHLREVTGVTIPVQQEASAGDAGKMPALQRRIVIGPSEGLRAAMPQLDLAALGHDGIVLKTVGDTLYLAGGRPRGTLYAVYTFLEDVVGCRWWSSSESFVPKKPTLEIPALDTVYAPKLMYREAYYRDAFDNAYAARSKCNGHFEHVAPEYGGHYKILGWCHTFYQILPPGKYFNDHPEWYSEIDGKRTGENAQLCLTNAAMRAEFVKNALDWIRKDPEAGIISIAQNDCGGNCQCPACAAIEKEEGAASGLLLRFVNSVAEDIQKEFPEELIETLAYTYTRQAPKLTCPRDNVIVRLCSIECSFAEPLATGPNNIAFRRDIEAWSAVAKRLYIWDYVTNFSQYLLPHPNLEVLAPNIRFFVDHNAVGLFEQGDAGSSCSDFPELRAWLLAHLMWNPARDANALIDEFLAGYYGPAAWPLRRYIDRIHDAVSRSGAYLHCFMSDTAPWLSLDDLNEATALFDEAQKAVEQDPVLSKRVRRARLPLDYAWLNRYSALKLAAKLQQRPFDGPADPVAACEDFIKTCNGFNVGQYCEGGLFADYESVLRSRFRAAATPPEQCKGFAENEWIDIQDNEFRLANAGVWAQTVDDPAASDKKAARMPATHAQWAVQYPVSEDLAGLGPLHCYLVARCEAKAAAGNAFCVGIYDSKAAAPVMQRVVSIEEAKGDYCAIDLGAHVFTDDMYVWVAPMNNPNEVDAIYVDRIFFVQERKTIP